MKILQIYNELHAMYGPQGWWPLAGKYKKGLYKNKNQKEKFEIITGAILTQNTSWKNVELALKNLREKNLLNPKEILKADKTKLVKAIKPAGYFNQKAKYLKNASKFFLNLNNRTPKREELLKVKGIGPETADSILLYAYHQPEFVVDLYTKRIFSSLGLVKESEKYNSIKETIESNLKKDWKIFQEYHALIVEHAKRHYQRKPYKDPLKDKLKK